MEIITGYTGQNHIESGDVQALLRGIMGNGTYLLDTGAALKPEILDANTVKISSGDIIFQGVHCRIPYGEYDTVTISNGSSNYNRTDVIALRYEKNPETDAESVSWAYYQGGSNGKPPAVTKGNIEEGALIAETVIFTIKFDRMTPSITNGLLLTGTLPNIEESAKSAVSTAAKKANESDAIYKPGNVPYLRYMPACGELYNNKTTLRYFVPLPRPTIGVTGVTLVAGTFMVRAGGAVTVNTTDLTKSNVRLTLYQNGIEVLVSNNGGFKGTNHSVVAVSGHISVRFT